jgi:hypothetical protein
LQVLPNPCGTAAGLTCDRKQKKTIEWHGQRPRNKQQDPSQQVKDLDFIAHRNEAERIMLTKNRRNQKVWMGRFPLDQRQRKIRGSLVVLGGTKGGQGKTKALVVSCYLVRPCLVYILYFLYCVVRMEDLFMVRQ